MAEHASQNRERVQLSGSIVDLECRCGLLVMSPPSPTVAADSSARLRPLRSRRVTAVVDTGATVSAIHRDIARFLGLQIIDRTLVRTASGIVETDKVLGFVVDAEPTDSELASPFRIVCALSVFEGSDDFLLGMDLLEKGRLLVDLVTNRWRWRRIRSVPV